MKILFLLCACISILAVAVICIFIFANGVPAIGKIGFTDFIFGTHWRPNSGEFGIFPMIVASIYVTAGAIVIGVLKNGMNLLGIDSSWQYIVQGIVILIAVYIDWFKQTGFKFSRKIKA